MCIAVCCCFVRICAPFHRLVFVFAQLLIESAVCCFHYIRQLLMDTSKHCNPLGMCGYVFVSCRVSPGFIDDVQIRIGAVPHGIHRSTSPLFARARALNYGR